MNRAYRLVWSDASQSYIPAPEFARGRGRKSRVARSGVLAAAIAAAFPALALDGNALPTGGQVVGGQATLSQTGSALTIQQTTTRAAIDWQSFNIGANASVTFQQPSASAIALNRVVGQDPSQILGSLSANGQVFIVNPSGVLFGRGAQVNAQGLLASTRDISVAGFMAGKDVFSGAGAGQVVNEGKLTAGPGGYVALIGAQVKNVGEIDAPQGDVRLAAADRVTVTLDHGGLAGFTVERGALDALAENGGLIRAEGGRIWLTADAADSLAKAVVNNTGVIEARGVENRDGTIVLLADMNVGTANVSGRLDASRLDGSKGGFIETSGHVVNIADGASLKAGHWLIDPADFTIAASGGNMTGATLSSQLGNGDVTILSSNGTGGGNGDIHVNDTVAWSANTLTLTAARDININAVMTASGTSKLVMNTATGNGADGGVYGGTVKVGFNADGSFKGKVAFGGRSGNGFLTINGEGYTVINSLGAEGSSSGADLQGMNGNLNGRYALGSDIDASATANWNMGFTPVGNSSTSFTGKFEGLGHTVSNLTINRPSADYVGLFGYISGATLRNVGLAGAWIGGHDNTGALVGRNDNSSIGTSYATGYVSGNIYVGGLVGRNHVGQISSSHAGAEVNAYFYGGGLAGYSDFSDIGTSYATGGVTGYNYMGGLVGGNSNSHIGASHADGVVNSNTYYVGGLVGKNDHGTIDTSYATGAVSGSIHVGGLVGSNDSNSIIGNSYATGNVSGSDTIGGLAGSNKGASQIGTSYATGAVSGSTAVGGLVGYNDTVAGSTVSTSFWNTETTGQAASAGGTGKTTAEMKQLSTYTAAGWDIDATGGTGKTWRIYEGQTGPLLRTFLTALTVTADSGTRTYDGSTGGLGVSYNATLSGHLLGSASTTTSSRNVGSRTATASGLYSDQQGYDIAYVSGAVDITPRALTVSGITASDKVYDGNTNAAVNASGAVLNGLVGGDDLTITSSGGTFANKNAGAGKTVNLLNSYSGADLGNYAIVDQATTTARITPKTLTVSGITASDKVYDGTTAATVNTAGATFSGLIAGDNLTATGVFVDKNAGFGKPVYLMFGGTDAGNYAIVGQAGTNASITPKTLTVSGITASDKVYDGNVVTTASTSGAVLNGLVAGDDLRVTSYGGVFADKNAGTGKTVYLLNGYSGWDLGNYAIVDQGTATASITPKTLTVSGITASNKVYDGTTNATLGTAGATFSGLIAGDDLTATGAFADKNAGSGKTVNLTYGGTDAGNYAIAGQSTATASITPKALTVSGITASDKVYDGTSTAAVNASNAVLNGLVPGDDLKLFYSSGAFADKNAGTGKTVNLVNGYSGMDLGNYVITDQATVTASITPKTLTVSGLTASDKVYDGTTATAVSTAGATFSGLVAGDNLTVAATGSFADKNAGSGKVITLASTYGGADLGNYAISGQAGTTASITPKALTVSGLTAADKVYDGTTAATVSTAGATFGGLIAGDDLTVAAIGAFSDKNAGAGKTVTLASTYGGADAGNYAIAGQAATTASITPKALTVSGIIAADKVYDGATAATVSTAGATFGGLVAGDDLTVAAIGAFSDKNAGIGKTVTLTSTFGGTDAGNYAIAGQAGTTASITPKALTVSGLTATDKVYDGSTAATVSTTGATFSGLVAGDDLTATGSFADKNAGAGKTVNLAYGGADLGNYAISGQANTTASITPRGLTVALTGPVVKTADGTAAATLTAANYTVGNVVAGESVSVTQASGRFDDAAPGANRTVTATLAADDYTAGAGTLLSNYRLVAGPVAGPVGEILTSNPSAAYTGALATGNTASLPVSVPAPASVPPTPAASTVLLANAHGLPLATLHIVDGGLRLPEPLIPLE